MWKLTDEQIAQLENSGEVSPFIDVAATTSGIVISKNVNQGDYVNTGTVLFAIADLSKVWAIFDAYESDLPFLKIGDQVEYTLQSLPGKTFTGRISFINPILDSSTRTAKVRVETTNPGMELKPEMYANAIIKSPLNITTMRLLFQSRLFYGQESVPLYMLNSPTLIRRHFCYVKLNWVLH